MPIRTFFLKLRRKRLLLLGAVCLLVLLTAIALYLCLPMPQGAALDGVSLSGLPYWKARAEANTLYPQTLRVSLPEEELTVENLNAISLQTAKDYGYFEEGAEDYYAMSWIDITHFFEQPWYVISYCVSNDAAFQIYQAELAEAGAGLALYEAILPRESDGFLDTIEEQGGMESPFAAGRMESTAALIREALD